MSSDVLREALESILRICRRELTENNSDEYRYLPVGPGWAERRLRSIEKRAKKALRPAKGGEGE